MSSLPSGGSGGLFSTRPVVATVLLTIVIGGPFLVILLLVGVPPGVAMPVMVVAAAAGAYAGLRLVRHPDDPGRFARLVRRLGGF